ncbi:MAG: ABC transporter permease, partial [Planctomycetes bacterium]|nr:ABC transporter permease [Planctomycetota bacterium]
MMRTLRPLSRWIVRHALRRWLRTTLTIIGVAAAVVLLVLVDGLASGVDRALSAGDAARTLIVYRANRYCPQTSVLPESHTGLIAGLDGVEAVVPVRVFLNNCRANLDVVSFHGLPRPDAVRARELTFVAGSADAFLARADAALVGERFASRKHLRVGDTFRYGRVSVTVAGITRSADAVNDSLVLTDLTTLQRQIEPRTLGLVTQFEVRVATGADPETVAKAIDAAAATTQAPTSTRPRNEFRARAIGELRELLHFARLFVFACVAMLVVLVANTVFLAIAERMREIGVLLALGYGGAHVAATAALEALLLGIVGTTLGAACAIAVTESLDLTLAVEGIPVDVVADATIVASA